MEKLVEEVKKYAEEGGSAIVFLNDKKRNFTLVNGDKKSLVKMFYAALKLDEEDVLIECLSEALKILQEEQPTPYMFPVKKSKFKS